MQKLISLLVLQGLIVKEKAKNVLTNERGEANIIAIILVLAIVILLAIVFRTQIQNLISQIWGSIFGNVGDVIN